MFARVATTPAIPRRWFAAFSARGELERMEGFSNAYFCVDRGSGKGLSMTLWETEAAREASAERAHQLRSQATQPAGATTDSVTHYEVALTADGARSATT
jgi:heme-degrading monooxygenase HmoA